MTWICRAARLTFVDNACSYEVMAEAGFTPSGIPRRAALCIRSFPHPSRPASPYSRRRKRDPRSQCLLKTPSSPHLSRRHGEALNRKKLLPVFFCCVLRGIWCIILWNPFSEEIVMAKKRLTKAERALAEQKESYDWIQSIISALIICTCI